MSLCYNSYDGTARYDQFGLQTSLSYKPENLSAARSLRTAIASAFLWPTRTTSLLPASLRCKPGSAARGGNAAWPEARPLRGIPIPGFYGL